MMSIHPLPRYLLTEGKERGGEERVSADEQFLRLIGNLDLVLNTRKIICILSKVYLNENSQTRISPLSYYKVNVLRVVALFFFFFLPYYLAGRDTYNTVYFQVNGLLHSLSMFYNERSPFVLTLSLRLWHSLCIVIMS